MTDLIANGDSGESVRAKLNGMNIRLPRNILLDMDLAGDPDDLDQCAVLFDAMRRGAAKCIGVNVSSTVTTSAPAARALFDEYGFPEVPVCAYQGVVGTYNNTYPAALRNTFGGVNTYNKTRANFTDDLTGMRTMLVNAPDGSVTILAQGGLVSLSRLLDSPADGISSLTGSQLLSKKLDPNLPMLVVGGTFPVSSTPEYNLAIDPASSQNVANNWPTKIIWQGGEVGGSVFSGPPIEADITVDPIAFGYDFFALFGGTLKLGRRQAWGALGTHYAIYGPREAYTFGGQNGTLTIDGSGGNVWSASPPGRHSYVTKIATDVVLGDEIREIVARVDKTPTRPRNRSAFTFPLTEGAGTVVTAENTEDLVAKLGFTTATSPAWVDLGGGAWVLDFNGSSHVGRTSYKPGYNSQQFVVSAVVKPDVVTGTKQLLARADDLFPNAVWQFLISSGMLQFTAFNSSGGGAAYNKGSAHITAGAWTMLTAFVNVAALKLYQDGVEQLSTTMTDAPHLVKNTSRILLGGRVSASSIVTDFFDGQVAAYAYKANAVAADVTTIETRLRAIATAKGITLP